MFIGNISSFMEVIHIELSDKRRKVVMFEELRQDFVSELVGLLHDEAIALLVPAYYVVVGGVLLTKD